MIYPIGDSHAWHVWLNIKEAAPYTVGPMTMHSFGENQPILTGQISKDDTVCFCYGEIDCRCHVHKYPPYQECINRLVNMYFDAIELNVTGFENVWIYNVVPPPKRSSAIAENPSFPFLGSDEERLAYVKYMNDELRQGCEYRQYKFVDIYKNYCLPDGFLDMEKSDGHVHIKGEAPILEWIHANT